MKVCDKIKYMRQDKGFSQEEIARKLDMSANGYGGIERGEVDIKLSRLEQISELFDIELSQLLQKEHNIFNFTDTSTQNHCNIGPRPASDEALQVENDKLKLIIEKLEFTISSQQQEVNYLKEIIALMKSKT
jgi:transcriptional regulator with XRE-family HTH domain